MKAFLTLIFSFILFSTLARATEDLSPVAKKLVFDAIAAEVYVEEAGLVRAPQKISDFKFDQINDETVIVTGNSYSELDKKVIGYNCEIEILGRGTIESEYDFAITACNLKI